MSQPTDWTPTVVAEPHRAEALNLLWAALEPDVRQHLYGTAVNEGATYGPDYWSALVAYQSGGGLAGVAWVQPQAGRVAILHGPMVNGDCPQLAANLACCSVERAAKLDLTCIQALLPVEYTPQAKALVTAGFQPIAELLYLFCDVVSWPVADDETVLRFRTASHDELAGVVEQTYPGSLDCPALDGLRTMDDILASYRATGSYRPENWQVVSIGSGRDARDLGCLILADHPTTGQVELVYMGIVAEERGNRWGARLVRQAQRMAQLHGRKRVVLAVDQANIPAVRMYAEAGFITFDHKTAWHRSLLKPTPGD